MTSQKIGCMFITLIVSILVGTLLLVLPIFIDGYFSYIKLLVIDAFPDERSPFLQFASFVYSIFDNYLISMFKVLPSTLAVTFLLSIVGFRLNCLPIKAAILAFLITVILDSILAWRLMLCKCEAASDSISPLLQAPSSFLFAHGLLAFGVWFIVRPIWRKALAQ